MKTAESNKAMVVSQATRKTRPQSSSSSSMRMMMKSSIDGLSVDDNDDESSRRTEFSFSLANMIQVNSSCNSICNWRR